MRSVILGHAGIISAATLNLDRNSSTPVVDSQNVSGELTVVVTGSL